MLVKTYGSAIQGIEATTVTVEVNIDDDDVVADDDDDVDDDDVVTQEK